MAIVEINQFVDIDEASFLLFLVLEAAEAEADEVDDGVLPSKLTLEVDEDSLTASHDGISVRL